MAAITASTVKELREKTGAGMMDCKKALEENKGNMEEAIDWLRKKGIAKAAKKAGRTAAEGLVGVVVKGTKGAVIELNSETDFVARNEGFQKLVRTVSTLALDAGGSLDKLLAASYPGTGRSVGDEIQEHIATIGENMNLRRVAGFSVKQGVVVSYIHNVVAEGLGKIGVLIALESAGNAAKLQEVGRQIAMHVAAARPEALTQAEVTGDALKRERAVFAEQARASGKPDNIIEKMVEGRIRKYYEEVVLLDQLFVMDGKTKISDVVAAAAKEAGAPITLSGFVRLELGEGVEKEETDFAAEVAKVAGV